VQGVTIRFLGSVFMLDRLRCCRGAGGQEHVQGTPAALLISYVPDAAGCSIRTRLSPNTEG